MYLTINQEVTIRISDIHIFYKEIDYKYDQNHNEGEEEATSNKIFKIIIHVNKFRIICSFEDEATRDKDYETISSILKYGNSPLTINVKSYLIRDDNKALLSKFNDQMFDYIQKVCEEIRNMEKLH